MSDIDEIFTNDFFKKVLEKKIVNLKDVLNVKPSEVIEGGQNFTSGLIRMRVTYSTTLGQNNEVVTVIVKFVKDTEEQKELNSDLNLYDNESTLYGEVFPLIENLGFPEKIVPSTYLITKQPKAMLIMEDLSVLGYKMRNRQEGFDLEHCLMVMKKLATFHAASVALFRNNHSIFKRFSSEPPGKEKIVQYFTSVTYPELIKVLSKVEGLQKYINKIPKMEDVYQKINCAKTEFGEFDVLNHGDFWCNNILFKYKDDGEVTDVVFVDYQLSYYGSPSFDLHHFFGTSVRTENKIEIINKTLDYYIDELLLNLSRLNMVAPPTREELLADFKKRAMIGFGYLVLGAPLFRAGKREDATIKKFLEEEGEDSFRYHCFNNPQFVAELQQLLPYYDNLGVFD
ncbi:hypothetical protein FQA39_LY02841 [Lamprigera yunnana]|nr:hypothetical protein FQA39_LY02841 [Lamprigera yunnana]